jgi:hypothetical protein
MPSERQEQAYPNQVSNRADMPGPEEPTTPEEAVLTPLELKPGSTEEGVLTPLEPEPGSELPRGLELPGLAPPRKGPEWIESRHLAESRRFIAYWLLGILSGVIILSWTTVLTGVATFQDVQALMTIIFAPIIGLVGAATGFYFGERAGERAGERIAQERSPGR